VIADEPPREETILFAAAGDPLLLDLDDSFNSVGVVPRIP
jgi:hypothetical protein